MQIVILVIQYAISLLFMAGYTVLLPIIEGIFLILENVIFSEKLCRKNYELNVKISSAVSKKETPEERRKEAESIVEYVQGSLEQCCEKARLERVKYRFRRAYLINVWGEEKRYLVTQGKNIWSHIKKEIAIADKKKKLFFLPLDKTDCFWEEILDFLDKEFFKFYSIQAIWMDEYNIYWLTLKVLKPKYPENDNLPELIKAFVLYRLKKHPGFMSIPDTYWKEDLLYCTLRDNSLILGIAASEGGKEKLLSLRETEVQEMARELTEDL